MTSHKGANDRADLQAAVPEDFVRTDLGLHELSAKLAEATSAGGLQLQHGRFGQTLEACTACHSRYATDRFPAFGE